MGRLGLNLCMCSCVSLTNRKCIKRSEDEIVRGRREDKGEKQKWRLAGRREETSCRGRDSGSEEEVRSKEDDIHVIIIGHGEA